MGCGSTKAASTATPQAGSQDTPEALDGHELVSTPSNVSSSRRSCEKAAAEAEDVLADVQEHINTGDWAAAEQVILQALKNAVGYARALWERLSSEASVRETCLRSQRLLAGKMSLQSRQGLEWRPGPRIPVDFRKLCPAAPEAAFAGVNPFVETRWRYTKERITLQIMAELPSEHPVLKVPFAQGLFAMFGEVDLMHNWYPVISTKHPPNILNNKADFLAYENCIDVPFITRDQGLLEVHRFFLPSGIIVQRTQWVLDPEDERIKNMTKIPGYRLKDEPDLHSLIIIFGAEKGVVIITQENEQKSAPWPSVVETFINWILPFMCKRMLAIGCGIFDDKDYGSRMQSDEAGLYKRIRESHELGKKRERDGGPVFSVAPGGRMPIPADLGEAGDLLECARGLGNDADDSDEEPVSI